ncbi:AraC family transcriptional regulator [Enterococcus casseliflavus]|uniref:AraC family transcriptional regulator n=1 Tax=Enterococcus casseliflavus TaxID=37734 RepID=UPI003D110BDC
MGTSFLDKLTSFDADEIFYKEYYEAKRDGNLPNFLQKYSPVYIKEHSLICPDIVETNSIKFTEQYIFEKKNHHDVVLLKHPRYTPEFIHKHNYFEAFYVFNGHCQHTYNEKMTILHEGTLFFIAPDTYHSVGVFDDQSIIINFLIRKDTLKKIFLANDSSENILSEFFLSNLYSIKRIESLAFHNIHDDLKIIINELLSEQFNTQPYYAAIMTNLISLFFYRLLRENETYADIEIFSDLKNENSLKMLSYIHDNFQTITLQELSEKFNYSIEHTSRLLKSEFGKTYAQIIRSIKISKAEELLVGTSLSIEDICYEVGYESLSSFQRLFKKIHGKTPGEYRLNHIGKKVLLQSFK